MPKWLVYSYRVLLVLSAPVIAIVIATLFSGDNTSGGVFFLVFLLPLAILVKIAWKFLFSKTKSLI